MSKLRRSRQVIPQVLRITLSRRPTTFHIPMNSTTRATKEHQKRRGGIDPAALAAASLASAVSTIAQPGPYTPITTVVAITLVLLIVSYDIEAYRTALQSLAYSAVVGLTSALGLGFPFECYFGVCLSDAEPSAVPQWISVLSWAAITGLAYLLDGSARERRKEIGA